MNESYGLTALFKERLLRPILLFYEYFVLLNTQLSISTGNDFRLGTPKCSQHTTGAFILYWETLYIVIAGSLIMKVSGQAPYLCSRTKRSRLSVQMLNCQKYGRTGEVREGPSRKKMWAHLKIAYASRLYRFYRSILLKRLERHIRADPTVVYSENLPFAFSNMASENSIIAIQLQTPCYEVTGGLQNPAQTMFANSVMNGRHHH
ncbi:hypothetical protein [Paenochrobactrum pullorum]|uniref:hypothetical protein n=3 Tax=Paenochrobactrum TaxID=999488 RepID=UPI0035BC48ED